MIDRYALGKIQKALSEYLSPSRCELLFSYDYGKTGWRDTQVHGLESEGREFFYFFKSND